MIDKMPPIAVLPDSEGPTLRARRPSIVDVAKACGVVPSTVSNALSGKNYVSDKTRKLVQETADRLGYRANTLARSLRLQRSWSIGLILANISNPFYPEVARGVEDIAAEEDWNVILCNTDYQSRKQDQYLEILLDRHVDGIILASHPNEHHVRQLRDMDVPFVLLNKGHGLIEGDFVGVDNRHGSALAVDHLYDLGHRRIAYIQGHRESDAADQRYEGFQAAMSRHGLSIDPDHVFSGEFDFVSGEQAVRQFLKHAPHPSAIVAASDLMAMGAIKALAQNDLRVPDDVSVVGFDDILFAGMPRVGLTTIRIPKWDLGAAAARILLERIQEEVPSEAHTIIEPTELIVRDTTAAPSVNTQGNHQ